MRIDALAIPLIPLPKLGGPLPAAEPVPALPVDQYQQTQGNRIDLLIDGEAAFGSMEKAIDGATKTIDLETFIFDRDETAWRIAEKLAVKAEKGVKVRVLFDRLGTYGAGKKATHPTEIYDFMQAHGVELVGYGPVEQPKPFPLMRTLSRFLTSPPKEALEFRGIKVDHRKMLVVDGKTAFTGGMNIGDHYAHEWHDVMVKLEGPVVGQFSHRFEENWRNNGGQHRALLETPLPVGDVAAHTVATGTADRSAMQAFYGAIAASKERVILEVPYLTDDQLTVLLSLAAKRGVKVQVIVPDPAHNNHTVTAKAAIASYPMLLNAGVEIYHYQGRMTHAKAMAVDDKWATIGSTNGTHRSFRSNQELNVAFHDAEAATGMRKELFEPDMANSVKVTEVPQVGWADWLCDLADRNF